MRKGAHVNTDFFTSLFMCLEKWKVRLGSSMGFKFLLRINFSGPRKTFRSLV